MHVIYDTILIIQDGRKVMRPIPDSRSICQKINYIEIRKQKTMLCKVLEISAAFSDACIHPFPHVVRNQMELLCHGNGSPDVILCISLA
jgi:hypothetical protein